MSWEFGGWFQPARCDGCGKDLMALRQVRDPTQLYCPTCGTIYEIMPSSESKDCDGCDNCQGEE